MKNHVLQILLVLAVGLAGNKVDAGITGDMASKIDGNSYKLKDAEKYIRAEATGKSLVKFLSPSTQKVQGKSTFTGEKTNDTELFLFKHFQVKFGSQATAGTEPIEAISMTDAVPPSLEKAHLVVNVNNKEKINIPLSVLRNKGVDNDTMASYYEFLQDGSYFDMGKQISIEIEIPDATVVPSDKKYYIEVAFLGVDLV